MNSPDLLLRWFPRGQVAKVLVQQAAQPAHQHLPFCRDLPCRDEPSGLPCCQNILWLWRLYGVGESFGPQLMAEIGDVRRFDRKQALVAFAGIDPMPNQSGEKNVRSNKSSKRGSPYLRKTLFSIMMCLLQSAPADEPVFQFLDRKRSEGKPYYVYMTAGANKFLRRYYAKVRDYLATLDNFPPVDMDSTGLNHLN